MSERTERIKAAWAVLRNGYPSIVFHPEPGVDYNLPDWTLTGPLFLSWTGNATMSGDLVSIEGNPPVAITPEGESEMTLGPWSITSRNAPEGDS